ncbi:testis-expressed protein 101 [Suricata suricatta]|uniref:Testis expressed 101 n=1 Tax=Suricata suricatta TaxID=37032 RepID=A0A673UFH6_SURSU|nr:testis-expressed protein 101 [Suricata suricatta]XP_029781103.1 testis-expressed protein 101 [Suricata suricatta]XP_029781104.1 testis-expressed protein 101 [Suricata suricatta]
MGTRAVQCLLFLLLLGAPFLASVQNLKCHKGVSTSIEKDPSSVFNWTTEEAESCESGSFCQESLLMVKAGTKTAVLATKGCTSDGTQAVTYVQHSPPPGIITVSYTSYCDDSFCNNRKDLQELWRPEETQEASRAPNTSGVPLYCPTCVALGTCLTAPSLLCPNDTIQCYEGKLQISGGGIDSVLEIKGCTSVTGCGLMAGFFTIGPMWVKEVCPHQSLPQPRKVENGATWLPVSVWRLGLLLLLLLQ